MPMRRSPEIHAEHARPRLVVGHDAAAGRDRWHGRWRWGRGGRAWVRRGRQNSDLDSEVHEVRHRRDPERPDRHLRRAVAGQIGFGVGRRHAADCGSDLALVDGRGLQTRGPSRLDRDRVARRLRLAQRQGHRSVDDREARPRAAAAILAAASSRRLTVAADRAVPVPLAVRSKLSCSRPSRVLGSGSNTGSPSRALCAKSCIPAPAADGSLQTRQEGRPEAATQVRLGRVDVGLLDEEADAARAAAGRFLVGRPDSRARGPWPDRSAP